MKSTKLLLLLLVCTLTCPSVLTATPSYIKSFQRVLILDQGRIKPMDTFARNLLKQFSGRSFLGDMDAASWLARVFFSPWDTRDDRIFLVIHPDVLSAIGLPAQGRGRYSFRQLHARIGRLQELAYQVSSQEGGGRGEVESEIIRLFYNVSAYYHMTNAFHFAWSKVPGGKTAKVGSATPAIILLGTSAPEEWLSPAAAKARADDMPDEVKRELSLLARAARAYGDRRWADFSGALADFNRSLDNRLPRQTIARGKVALEVAYNRFELFFKAKLAYGLALLLLALSWAAWHRWLRRLSLGFLLLGLSAHTGGMIVRMLITGRPPVTNLYETFVFVGWAGVAIGLALEWFQKHGLGILCGGLAGLVFLTIAGRFALEGDTMGMLAAVLDSNLWLSTHVVTISIGYAGCVVAGIIGHWLLVQLLLRQHDEVACVRTENLLLAALAVGLAFTGIGTIMGGIWADQSWGRFWGWDPKENGALLIILWCAILFHARLAGWIGQAGLAAGAVGAIIAVALTWLGVNLLGLGMHAYGFTTGVGRGLAAFIICELTFIILTTRRIRKKKR